MVSQKGPYRPLKTCLECVFLMKVDVGISLYPLIEFSCNNSYHASIGMTPYDAFYGRKYRSLLCWCEVGEKTLIGPYIVQETTYKIMLIRERMCTAHSRKKSYAGKRRKPLEFQGGEHVLLRVTPKIGVGRSMKVIYICP